MITSQDNTNVIEATGLSDAYSYVLKWLYEHNCPQNNVFSKCSDLILEYEKSLLPKNEKAKQFIEMVKLSDYEIPEALRPVDADVYIPKSSHKLELQSRKLLSEINEGTEPFKNFITEGIKSLLNNNDKGLSSSAYRNELFDTRGNKEETFEEFVKRENFNLNKMIIKTAPQKEELEFISMDQVRRINSDVRNSELAVSAKFGGGSFKGTGSMQIPLYGSQFSLNNNGVSVEPPQEFIDEQRRKNEEFDNKFYDGIEGVNEGNKENNYEEEGEEDGVKQDEGNEEEGDEEEGGNDEEEGEGEEGEEGEEGGNENKEEVYEDKDSNNQQDINSQQGGSVKQDGNSQQGGSEQFYEEPPEVPED